MKWVIEKNPIAFQLTTFIWLIFFVITTTLTIGWAFRKLSNRLDTNEVWKAHIIEMLNSHETRIVEVETSTNKIETDLARIKMTLIEIKDRLK